MGQLPPKKGTIGKEGRKIEIGRWEIDKVCLVWPHSFPSPDKEPTMPQLIGLRGKDKNINIAEAIGGQWRVVGIALLNDESGDIVKGLAKEFRGNAQDINLEILQCWLQGRGIADRTWRGLIGVLRMYCGVLAESVEEALTAKEAEQGKL